AAAMSLIEECRIRLDDPVDNLLPELAGRKVLRHPGAALDDTVPAIRPITVRDLLTFRMGLGAIMAPPGQTPIQRAMGEMGVAPGKPRSRGGREEVGLPRAPAPPPVGPDEYMKRLGSLPLVFQPGERWMYHTGSDVLGVLMARAAGQPLDELLAERLFRPLSM